MKKHTHMTPMDIIQEMNRQFDDAIIATDVGAAPDVCHSVRRDYGEEAARDLRRTWDYGVWIPCCHRSEIGQSDKTVIAISGDGGMQMNIQEFATAVLEELPLILCGV